MVEYGTSGFSTPRLPCILSGPEMQSQMTTMTSYPQGCSTIKHDHHSEVGQALEFEMLMMRSSATVSMSHLPTTDSSSGRFHAALSPWLFRDAAGALEARLDSETTLTVPTEALRQWVNALEMTANGVRLQMVRNLPRNRY